MLEALNENWQKEQQSLDETILVEKRKMTQIDIEFFLKNELLYHQNDDEKVRLCISKNCEKKVFELTHDQTKHMSQQKSYQQLKQNTYILRMTKKLHLYIKHCLSYQFNQIKRHKSYEELRLITFSIISFHIIIMNFILTILSEMNIILTISNKIIRRKISIIDKTTYSPKQWADLVFEKLLIANWDIPQNIIFDKNLKFMSKFWKQLFKRLNIKLLMSTSYHSQTNDLSKRINQTIEIILRFIIIENSNFDVVKTLSTLQFSLNNVNTTSTEYSSNELMYDFKIRGVLTTLSFNARDMIATSDMKSNVVKKTEKRFIYVKKVANVIAFVNAKAKTYYDKKHQSLLLQSNEKAYIKLHHEYKLLDVLNKKLNNQRADSFLMKRRIRRLTYELNLSFNWKIHSVISIIQIKSTEKRKNSYNRYKFHHFDVVKIEKDIDEWKFYEIEKIIKKRIRRYDKTNVIQYLIRWLRYESAYDEWKSLTALSNCLKLIKKYEMMNNEMNDDIMNDSKVKKKRNMND